MCSRIPEGFDHGDVGDHGDAGDSRVSVVGFAAG
jgi:hypothetical protein